MAASPEPSLVIFAWGNASRGDDGAGPELARRLRDWQRPGLVVIEDMQLQIEHTMDIVAHAPVLFVDASVALTQGCALQKLTPQPDASVTTHALCPSALLQLYETTARCPAPDAYLLHVAGRQFALGEQPGKIAQSAIEGAWQFLQRTLTQPQERWREALETSVAFGGDEACC